jgi:hypothetical protein
MSSPAVREAIREAWLVLTPDIPFVETINDKPPHGATAVPLWGTLIFDVIGRGAVTMGSRPWREETGTATIALMSYAGVGDDVVAQAASQAMLAWDEWISADGSIWIQSVEGPRPPDLEAVGDAFRLAVTLNYTYQTRGGS